tara:strand:+ start:1857 stop:2279 length:423 start_codon:yes stop_codon:yes gene_type:complete
MESQYIRSNQRVPTRRQNLFQNINSTAPPTTAPTEETLEFSFFQPPPNLLSSLMNLTNQQTATTNERLTLAEINANTTLITMDVDSEETCSICRTTYEENNICRKINGCGHIFHSNCLDSWLADNRTCPLCRASIVPTTN